MLDINLFREDKGNDPERVRESQRRRGASVELIDEVIGLDKEWRKSNPLSESLLLLLSHLVLSNPLALQDNSSLILYGKTSIVSIRKSRS